MDKQPEIKHCPFCGGDVYFNRSVPRCKKCRAVFFVQFSRYMRAPRKVPNDKAKRPALAGRA